MLTIEKTEVFGWEAAIRGMRNPKNSWNKTDSYWTYIEDPVTAETAPFEFFVEENDMKLMKTLRTSGSDHRKYLRMINVTCDITAPLYWWKEFDTYKVGTVANSCSTMHKIAAKPFERSDFSCEHLGEDSLELLDNTIDLLNSAREGFLATKDKVFWWQMIQLLPSSYNQKRTIQMNYEVLCHMYQGRKAHKLDEWRVTFCNWVRELPYAKELILGESESEGI